MMKPLLFTVAFVCAMQTVLATDYYFSSSAGNDSYSGGQAQNPNTPWRTLDKLNALFPSLKPGDAVYLKRGDVFYGAITATTSGNSGQPITIGVYGSGEQPVISGLSTLSAWTSMGGNVWACTSNSLGSIVNTVLINDAAQEMGRYPNSDEPGRGYLSIKSFVGNSSITDSKLPSSPNWTGAEVVIRKRMSIIDRNRIKAHSGGTLFYNTASTYTPAEEGFGYFIQNHRSTLDKDGEWYYDPSSRTLYVYFSNNNPYSYDVKASSVDNLITAFRQSHLVFDNLTLKGANKCGFNLVIGNQSKISNCNVLFSGEDGIRAASVTNLVVENSVVKNSMNNGISLLYGNEGSMIRNNYIENSMPFAGMGQSSDNNGIGILASSNDVLVEHNKVINTGFNGISFFGNNVVIKNNFVDRFCVNKNDGGGIYTYAGHMTFSNRKVIGNIVLNGQGVTDGMPAQYATNWRAEGINLDDNSMNVEVSGNTIAYCKSFGIFMANASNNVVTNNTVYNNEIQLVIARNAALPNTVVTNNNITNNILFSKSPSQLVSSLYDLIGSSLANYGRFDSNYYVQPFGSSPIISNSQLDAHNRPVANIYALEDWKPRYNKDASSKSSPVQIPAYTVNAITSGNKFPNPTFDQNSNWVYSWSAMDNSVVSWANGPLDGGCFKLSFKSGSGNSNQAVVNAQVGSLTGGKTYRLKFSLKGTGNHNPSMTVYLRQTGAPYSPVSDKKYVKIAATRTENEMVFSVPQSVDDATLLFEINDQSTPFWIDNVELVETNASIVNPYDHIRFEYNATQSAKVIVLNDAYIDATGKFFSNIVTLAPYTSIVLIKQMTFVTLTATCSATGSILREQWNDIQGNNINTIPWHTAPHSSRQLTALETQPSGQYVYGARIRGYICPPQTGNYTFKIAGDEAAELWLSTDDNPANKVKIAGFSGFTLFHEWNKYPTQQSAFIFLQQGKRYYIEVLHKQGVENDHVSVAWQLPDGKMEAPIKGTRLTPYVPIEVKMSASAVKAHPNPFNTVTTVTVSPEESGTATVDVYSLSGMLVQRLFSGQLQAGQSRSFTLNGQELIAGVYIVRFTTRSKTVTQKMTLAK